LENVTNEEIIEQVELSPSGTEAVFAFSQPQIGERLQSLQNNLQYSHQTIGLVFYITEVSLK